MERVDYEQLHFVQHISKAPCWVLDEIFLDQLVPYLA